MKFFTPGDDDDYYQALRLHLISGGYPLKKSRIFRLEASNADGIFVHQVGEEIVIDNVSQMVLAIFEMDRSSSNSSERSFVTVTPNRGTPEGGKMPILSGEPRDTIIAVEEFEE